MAVHKIHLAACIRHLPCKKELIELSAPWMPARQLRLAFCRRPIVAQTDSVVAAALHQDTCVA